MAIWNMNLLLGQHFYSLCTNNFLNAHGNNGQWTQNPLHVPVSRSAVVRSNQSNKDTGADTETENVSDRW